MSLWAPLCLTHSMSCCGVFFLPLSPTVLIHQHNLEGFVLVCNFHISDLIYLSIFKSLHSPFMSVWQTFSFLPKGHLFLSDASAFIRIKKHWDLLLFPWVFFLSVTPPSNDTFCQSKCFQSLSLFLKKLTWKAWGRWRKMWIEFNLRFNLKDEPRSHSKLITWGSFGVTFWAVVSVKHLLETHRFFFR